MVYIASRKILLPSAGETMDTHYRYNLWSKKFFPYDVLAKGGIVFWYESSDKCIEWKTVVETVERFEFRNSVDVERELTKRFGYFKSEDYSQDYFKGKNKDGFCLAYKVKTVQKLSIVKPDTFIFPQIGWMSGNHENAKLWLGKEEMR